MVGFGDRNDCLPRTYPDRPPRMRQRCRGVLLAYGSAAKRDHGGRRGGGRDGKKFEDVNERADIGEKTHTSRE